LGLLLPPEDHLDQVHVRQQVQGMSAFDLQVLSLHVDNHLGRTVDCHDGQLKEVSSHIELISFNERSHFGQHFLLFSHNFSLSDESLLHFSHLFIQNLALPINFDLFCLFFLIDCVQSPFLCDLGSQIDNRVGGVGLLFDNFRGNHDIESIIEASSHISDDHPHLWTLDLVVFVLKSQHLNEIAIESGVFSLDYLLSQTSLAHYLEQNKGDLLHS
jgi:hypothetical protein